MDALANPDNINTLVVLSTHHEGTLAESKDSVNVPLLHSWAMPPLVIDKSDNCLKPNLEEVLNNPELLYLFMQHIKETGPVNLLQFCLEIGNSNLYNNFLVSYSVIYELFNCQMTSVNGC